MYAGLRLENNVFQQAELMGRVFSILCGCNNLCCLIRENPTGMREKNRGKQKSVKMGKKQNLVQIEGPGSNPPWTSGSSRVRSGCKLTLGCTCHHNGSQRTDSCFHWTVINMASKCQGRHQSPVQPLRKEAAQRAETQRRIHWCSVKTCLVGSGSVQERTQHRCQRSAKEAVPVITLAKL